MKKNILLFAFSILLSLTFAQNKKYNLLVGTYTNTGKSQGIYAYNLNMGTGRFSQKSVTTGITNPSYLTISSDKKFVYSVSESTDGSSATAFSFDQKTAKLHQLNASLTKSAGPCYISSTGNHVFTANYGGGSISVFGRKKNGSLTGLLQLIQHTGNSIDTDRQKEPHVHQVIISPDQKYLLVNDLGTDKVTVYQYNKLSTTDILTPTDTLTVKPGSGPRHATFSKDGSKLYLVQEIDGTVSVVGFEHGKLHLLQETSLVKKQGIVNRAADIHLSPDQRFLYATNRGTANDISCFSVEKNGQLNFVQQVSTGGDGPRNFAITPDGKYLFVAHQFSNNIVIFKRNIQTGLLTDTGKRIDVGAPVCLVFY